MLHPRPSLARWRPVLHGITTTNTATMACSRWAGRLLPNRSARSTPLSWLCIRSWAGCVRAATKDLSRRPGRAHHGRYVLSLRALTASLVMRRCRLRNGMPSLKRGLASSRLPGAGAEVRNSTLVLTRLSLRVVRPFLWPSWVHKRATISVKHAWRCTGCLHCFFHRRAAGEHECTGLPPCKDMSR